MKYTPYKFHWFFQKPRYGSKWYYGNFSLGLLVDSHPRWKIIVLALGFFEIGLSFERDAIINFDEYADATGLKDGIPK